jgi:hypothetical protein
VEHTAYNDQTIVRYLLNELSEEDQEHFEDAYLADENLFDQVRAVEEELIEDFVRGDLSDRERQLFERHYLASEQRRARVAAARQQVQVCSSQSAMQAISDSRIDSGLFSLGSWLRSLRGERLALGFGAATAILLLVAGGLVIELQRLRGQLVVISEERAALERRAEEAEQRLAYEREQPAEERKQGIDQRERPGDGGTRPGSLEQRQAQSAQPAQPIGSKNQIVLLALEPGVRDINNPDKVVISADTRFIQLRVPLERQEKQRSYRAVVKTVDGGREIWVGERIKLRQTRSAQYIVFSVPADRFKAAGVQDFTLTVSAPAAAGKDYEEIESYYFEVIVR